MSSELEKIKEIVTPIFKANNIEFAGVFGSFARGEQKADSDVDILVKFAGSPTFAGYFKVNEAVKEALGREVDLITIGAVNKYLKPQIDKDLQVIYGQRPNLLGRN